MSVIDTAASNYDKTAYTTLFETDKIIGVYTGTISVNGPTALEQILTNSAAHTTGFGDSCYFEGIFSIDNGTTWNDFNAYPPDLSTPGMPVFQTYTVYANVSSSGIVTITAENNYDNVHASSTNRTYLYKIYLIAKNDQGEIEPLTSTIETNFDSRYNYHKIYTQGRVVHNTTSGSTTTTTVSHPLGYVPKVKAWYVTSTGAVYHPSGQVFVEVRVSNTSVVFRTDNALATTASGYIDYRIYYEN